jgi:hypothetical protein
MGRSWEKCQIEAFRGRFREAVDLEVKERPFRSFDLDIKKEWQGGFKLMRGWLYI